MRVGASVEVVLLLVMGLVDEVVLGEVRVVGVVQLHVLGFKTLVAVVDEVVGLGLGLGLLMGAD